MAGVENEDEADIEDEGQGWGALGIEDVTTFDGGNVMGVVFERRISGRASVASVNESKPDLGGTQPTIVDTEEVRKNEEEDWYEWW